MTNQLDLTDEQREPQEPARRFTTRRITPMRPRGTRITSFRDTPPI